MSDTRKAKIRNGLAEVAFRGFSMAGVLSGLFWGLNHEPHVRCARDRGTSEALNQCTSHTLSDLAVHWGVALGGGALVGATIGVILARIIRPHTPAPAS